MCEKNILVDCLTWHPLPLYMVNMSNLTALFEKIIS